MADSPRDPPSALTVPTSTPPSFPSSAGPAPEVLALPGYEVLGELGRGGMGVVYRARQTGLNRTVALKMILAGEHADADQLARFRAEAEAVARLQHPNIVLVYEVGEHQGLPYFSMEFVEGGSLERKLGGTPLPARQAAALVETLAQAMHAAHQAGIVHRDLKPANVLLSFSGRSESGAGPAPLSERPLNELVPKITDFGLAKRLDDQAGRTQSGAILGTPSYMAPEQAAGQTRAVGPAADVYALGAILYECLTGRPPFKAATALDTILQVLSDEPVPPARLQPQVPRDLDVLCLKCLAKTPGKRYASAAALADDLRSFRDGRPIKARPAGLVDRAIKWARRRPTAAALLAIAAAAAVLLVLGLTKYYRDLAAKQDQVQAQLERTRHSLYAQQLALVANVWERDPVHGLDLLRDPERCPEDLRDFAWGFYYRLCRRDRLTLRGAGDPVALSPDGKTLATGGFERLEGEYHDWGALVRLWDPLTGKLRATLRGHTADVIDPSPGLLGIRSLAFSADGKLLASGGPDGLIKLWDVATAAERGTLRGHKGGVNSLAFAPDGKTLAAAGGEAWPNLKGPIGHSELKLWDVATGRERAALQHEQGVFHAVTFSPDGKTLAAGNAGPAHGRLIGDDDELPPPPAWNTLELWDVAGPQPRVRAVLARNPEDVTGLAFSPDGATLAAATSEGVKLWDPATGRERPTLQGLRERVNFLTFSRDGKALATTGNGVARVWDVATGRERVVLRGRRFGVRSVVFYPDGNSLAGAGGVEDNVTAQVWDLAVMAETATVRAHASRVEALVFADGGTALATLGTAPVERERWAAEVKLWELVPVPGSWPPRFGEERASMRVPARYAFLSRDHATRVLAFSPDGKSLLATGLTRAGEVRLFGWDLVTGAERPGPANADPDFRPAVLSPDGGTAATSGNAVCLWDVATGRRKARIVVDPVKAGGLRRSIRLLAFAPDGKTLAGGGTVGPEDPGQAGGATGVVQLWDTATGRERAALRFPTRYGRWATVSSELIYAVLFTADSRTVLVHGLEPAGDKGVEVVRRWDVASGRELGSCRLPDRTLLAVSPDGRTLAGLARRPMEDVTLPGPTEFQLWDAATGQELATFAGHTSPVRALVFFRDGQLLASADERGTVKLWPAAAYPRPPEDEEDQPAAGQSWLGALWRDLVRFLKHGDGPLEGLGRIHIPWLVLLLALYPIRYVSAFGHELGHALMGRWNGFVVTSFGLGTGRPFGVRAWRGSRVYLALQRPLQGITFTVAAPIYPTRRQLVGMLAGGVLANFVLAAVCLALWRLLPWGGAVWMEAAVINAALGVVNLIPSNSQIGTFQLRTDGGKIWQVLRGGALPVASANRINVVAGLRGLWESTGDRLGLYVHLLGAATAWRELGDVGRAEELCAEAEAVPVEHTAFTRAYGALVRAAIARAGGRFDASARGLEEAESGFRALGHEAGLFLVSFGRAEQQLAEGRAVEAAAALDLLAGHALVRARPLLRVGLLESRLCARAALPDGDGVDALRTEYERQRRSYPSPTRDLRIYQALARLSARRQDGAAAASVYRAALAAADKLHGQLTDPADLERFARCEAELLAEATACLRALGKAAEAEELAATFLGEEAPKSSPDEVRQRRNRRFQGLARALTGLNALVAVALVVLVRVRELRATGPAGSVLLPEHAGGLREVLTELVLLTHVRLGPAWAMFLVALVPCVLLVSLSSAVGFAVGRFLPVRRGRGGGVLLYLALLPWGVLLVGLLLQLLLHERP
jgi:WD40 repeat protein